MRIGKRLCLGCSALLCFLVASTTPQGKTPSSDSVLITYDFLNPSTSPSANIIIKSRRDVWVKVTNFNSFLYDLTISGQVVSYNQNFPALLTAALAGSAPNPEDAKQAAATKFKPNPAIAAYAAKKVEFETALKAVYTTLPEAERIVVETIGYSDDLSKPAILDRIKKREATLCGLRMSGHGAQITRQKIITCLSSIITNVGSRWEALEKIYEEALKNEGLGKQEKTDLQADHDAESVRWRTFEGTDRAKFEGALNNAVSAWQSIEDSKFEISGGPFFADGDELIIKIAVTRKAGLDARFPTKRTCSEKPIARLRTRGGIKVDFSAGFAFGRPVDRAYSLKGNIDNPAEAPVIAESKESESVCAVSPAVFLHVYPRTGRDVAFAGTFGIATNKSSEFDYYLGGSVLLGASQRFVLTIGINLRTISVLGAGLKEGEALPVGITTIPLSNVLHLGCGIGISFNLGGL